MKITDLLSANEALTKDNLPAELFRNDELKKIISVHRDEIARYLNGFRKNTNSGFLEGLFKQADQGLVRALAWRLSEDTYQSRLAQLEAARRWLVEFNEEKGRNAA